MSKHQTCAECDCGFVGPDSGIGSNLCESCSQELHSECREMLAQQAAENERLQAERKAYRQVALNYALDYTRATCQRPPAELLETIDREAAQAAKKVSDG